MLPGPKLPDRYELRRTLGTGGMGNLAVAWDRELQRKVALKLLRFPPDAEFRDRFTREARALAQLRCPHIVEVYDFDADAETPWIAMELVDGEDLARRAAPHPLEAYLQAAEGLVEVHAAGVVHRDVKPANILLTPGGRVVLIDFGLARGARDRTLTPEGMVMGTQAFLAPELLLGVPATPASDIFAWAASLFQALEGRVPLVDPHQRLLDGSDVDTTFRTIPRDSRTARILQRCLAVDPSGRPAGFPEILRLFRTAKALPPSKGPEASTEEMSRATLPLGAPAPRPPAPAPPTGVARARRGGAPRRPMLGGLFTIGAIAGLVGLLLRTSPRPRAEAVPAEPNAPPLHLDLAAELREARRAASSPTTGFRGAYQLRGAGAYDDLPGQRAWLDWVERGGRTEDLSEPGRKRLREVNRIAEGLGLVPPFGVAWFLEPPEASEDGHAQVLALDARVRHRKEDLEERAIAHPEQFPGAPGASPTFMGPRARLLAVLAASRAATSLDLLDAYLAPERRVWDEFAARTARSIRSLRGPEQIHRLRKLAGRIQGGALLAHGAWTGASPRRVLAWAPKNALESFLELSVEEGLANAAADTTRSPARTVPERLEDWAELARTPELPRRLRREAWVQALRGARTLKSRPTFRRLDGGLADVLEASLSQAERNWLEELRDWAAVRDTP